PLFDRDHRLAGEPVFASPVLAEPYQIERGLHRREHAVKLLLAVAMSVHEPGKIARSERRLVVRDRIERESRLGEDARAVAARDLHVSVNPLALEPLPRHARGGGADLVLRLEIDALRFQ